MKRERQSNIELLRIISMMLVLLTHYTNTREQSDLLNTFANLELKSLSFVCTHCFLLISGYFGIKFKSKSIINLLFQMLFWNIVCIIVAFFISGASAIPSVGAFINTIVCGWFPTGYIILVVVSPILNSFINTAPKEHLGTYIIYFYILSTIGGYILGWTDFGGGMSALSMCGLYLIGAYLRTSTLKIFTFKAKYDLTIYLLLGILLAAFSTLLQYFNITKSLYGYLNPIIIIMSVYLFLFFSKINLGSNKIINFLSASAFSIYLFHYNTYIYHYIYDAWSDINTHFGTFYSILVAALSFIAIYLACTIVDQIRIIIYKNVICKIKIKIPNNCTE